MILRRFSKHITDQNWFAVWLDVLVVITGIFIGLQVTDWNQGRNDIVRETAYLKRIAQDLEADIAGQKQAITLAQERMGYSYYLIEAATNPDLALDQPTRFIKALDQGGYTFRPQIAKTTFEEVKFAGDLGLIRDVDLRTQLSSYYDLLQSTTQWNYNRAHIQTNYNTRSAGILKPDQLGAYGERGDLEFTRPEAEAAYQIFTARPEFINWLPLAIDSNRESYRAAKLSLASAEELLAIIHEVVPEAR